MYARLARQVGQILVYCTQCGTNAAQEARFCNKCGTNLQSPIATDEVEHQAHFTEPGAHLVANRITPLLGGIVGAFIGFLLRPAAFIVGQLPFGVVISRGAFLRGLSVVLVPVAQRSFNFMLVGATLGFISAALLTLAAEQSRNE